MGRRLTTEEFIENSIKIHGNKFDYSKVDYKNNNTKVLIGCSVHGYFEQIPRNHLMGIGCAKCGRVSTAEKLSKGTENFINQCKKIYGDKYDYSQVVYKSNLVKVKIGCKKHGYFEKFPSQMIIGEGCTLCHKKERYDKIRKSQDLFIKEAIKAHGNRYDYSVVNYTNWKTPVKIICRKHGVFEQIPNCHTRGKGCPLCANSKGEDKIQSILDNKKIVFERQKVFSDCKDKGWLRFDFYIPSKNMLIEYNGKQHYEPVERWGGVKQLENVKRRDRIKKDYAIKKGFNFFVIRYDEDIEEKLKGVI